MSLPKRVSISLIQGEHLDWTVTYRDANGDLVNLTGYSALLQVRSEPGSDVVAEFSTDLGTIAVTGSGLSLTITMTTASTLLIPVGCYQMLLWVRDQSGQDTPLIEGPFEIRPAIAVFE